MSKQSLQQQAGPILLALVIGALAGLGSVLFKQLIAFGQDFLWPAGYDLSQKVMRTDWWLVLLVPTGMGLLVGPVIAFWAPEVRGPGVPEVIEALILRGGQIRHRVTLIKTFVTAGLISAGASVGREGPIVQIGASLGSSLTQLLGLGPHSNRLAVACGAAAGIAATFQAPMAGTMFAVEVLLYDLEITSLSNIVIAAVTGTMTARLVWGAAPVFSVPAFSLRYPAEHLLYLGLGILSGFVSLLLMGGIFSLPRFWKKAGVPAWLTPACGGLLVGGIGLLTPWALGIGYESIDNALAGQLTMIFALSLFGGKILATWVSIGSGMSGGIFAPSLFLGAMLGSIIGHGAQLLWPAAGLSPAYYALIGMGAMVSGTTLAPITAILIIFELTYSYQVIMPLMVSCIGSLLVVRFLHGYSIYESKLLQKGINIVKGHEINILRGMAVRDHMNHNLQVLGPDTPCCDIITRMEQSWFPHFVVLDEEQKLLGVLTLRDFRRIFAHPELCKPETVASTLMIKDVVTVFDDSTMETAFQLFAKHDFSFLPVVSAQDPRKVVGQLKKTELLAAYDQYVFKEHVLSPLGWVCPLPAQGRRKEKPEPEPDSELKKGS